MLILARTFDGPNDFTATASAFKSLSLLHELWSRVVVWSTSIWLVDHSSHIFGRLEVEVSKTEFEFFLFELTNQSERER